VLPAERRRRLLELLDGRGAVRVTELADELAVSASTVRRDLAGMHRAGRIVRVHGGAGSAGEAVLLSAPTAVTHESAKRVIARAAAGLVVDGATIMLLSGTTTAAMVAGTD
jgi:DeoR/GlpR family transcriptional regulator of sugar metabolism